MRAIMSVILMLVLSVASATAGIRHYCDYLGSTRAVVDTAGVLLQTMNYYPSGVPFSRMEQEPITDRLHTGKPFLDMSGLGYYDNNARFLDILTGSFISRDALAGSYPHLSPYANCANNPLSIIDPTGMFVVFLPGTTQKYIDDFNAAVKYLQENNVGDNVNHILISEQVYFVGYGDDNMKGTGKGNSFNPTNNTIKWMNDKAIMTSSTYVLSPAEILNHEAAHAKRISENPSKVYENSAILDNEYGDLEEKEIITGTETETARKLGKIEQGEQTRYNHNGNIYHVDSPISSDILGCVVTPN